jgi:hypothetical protein
MDSPATAAVAEASPSLRRKPTPAGSAEILFVDKLFIPRKRNPESVQRKRVLANRTIVETHYSENALHTVFALLIHFSACL